MVVVVCLILAAGLAVWAALGAGSAPPRRSFFTVVVALALSLGASAALWSSNRAPEPAREFPQHVREDGYTSSAACRPCHPSQYQSWYESFHRRMTQPATPETVLGDFDGVELESRGRHLRLERRGDEYWVHLPDPDAEFARLTHRAKADDPPPSPTWSRVVMTTGSHYQQTYWVPLPQSSGLLQIGWSYLLDERRWIPREDLFLTPDSPERMPATWSFLCIRCHATGARIAKPEVPGNVSAEVTELGIGCEACHGPAAEHVRLNRDPVRRYGLHFGDQPDASVVNPRKLPHDRSSMVCGRCHTVAELKDPRAWWLHGDTFQPGDDLAETRDILEREPGGRDYQGAFWADGTYKAGGREFSGMRMSRCYTEGELSCVSCHSVHKGHPDKQLAPGMDGDQACLQCHPDYRERIVEHSRHAAGSTGSRCLNCHMPYNAYALFKGIRTHRIDSPTVGTSAILGRPNACNLCHLDKTFAWTADWLNRWYGSSEVELAGDENTVPASVLWLLRGDASQRAFAAWSMGWPPAQQASGTDWPAPFLAQLLEDPYAAVRRVSVRSLRSLPGWADADYDPLAPPADRSRAREEVLERWRRGRGDRSPSLPIGASLSLDPDTYHRLLAARDDRPITINE